MTRFELTHTTLDKGKKYFDTILGELTYVGHLNATPFSELFTNEKGIQIPVSPFECKTMVKIF